MNQPNMSTQYLLSSEWTKYTVSLIVGFDRQIM